MAPGNGENSGVEAIKFRFQRQRQPAAAGLWFILK